MFGDDAPVFVIDQHLGFKPLLGNLLAPDGRTVDFLFGAGPRIALFSGEQGHELLGVFFDSLTYCAQCRGTNLKGGCPGQEMPWPMRPVPFRPCIIYKKR